MTTNTVDGEIEGESARIETLREAAQAPHEGVFITGPEQIEHRFDSLPDLADDSVLLQSLINCRCSSDEKAIKQFDQHARVPTGTSMVAMGHETVQRVVQAPADSGLLPGDLVLITLATVLSQSTPKPLPLIVTGS